MKRLDKSVSVILAVTMLVSLVGCDSFRNNNDNGDNDKEEELITQEAAVAVAEEYSKALIALDSAKVIELSSKISDSNSEMISNYEFYEESKNVYEHWLTTFEYTIVEAEIDIDEDEGTVPVTISYVDLNSVATDSNLESEWLAGIDECEEKKEMSFDIKLKYDDDDGKIYVSNSDDIVEVFYSDILNTYIYVNTFVYYENAVTGSWSEDSYKTTENLKFDITFSDIPALDGTDVLVSIEDPDYDEVYTETITFEAGKTVTFTCKPSDAGVVEFEKGYYSINITNENSNFSFVASVKVERPELEPNDTDGSMIIAPNEQVLGSFDFETGFYTNEFFGFRYEVVDDLIPVEAEQFQGMMDNEKQLKYMVIDNFAGSSEGDVTILNLVGKFNTSYVNKDDPMSTFLGILENQGVEYEKIKVGDIDFYKYNNMGTDYFMTEKDGYLFIFCMFSRTDASIDDFIATFEQIEAKEGNI